MSSVIIDSPVHTPADEWAKNTTDSLQPLPFAHNNAKVVPSTSTVSTPGVDIPGAYPRDAVEGMARDSSYKFRDALGQGVETAKQYLPAQETVHDQVQAMKSYIPGQEDVQRVLGSAAETAKQYFPERVVTAVGNIMPHGMTSSNGTIPPDSKELVSATAVTPAKFPRDTEGPSFVPPVTEGSMSNSAAPLSNVSSAAHGISTTLDTASSAKFAKPATPVVSTSNIQEPYRNDGNISNVAEIADQEKPYPIEHDVGIERTNAALSIFQADVDAARNAPIPPPKDDADTEIVGRLTAEGVSKIDTEPTQGYVYSDHGLNAPPSGAANKVGGNANPTGSATEGTISQSDEVSDDSKEEEHSKKGRGSRLFARMKEKLHHKSN